MQSAIDRFRHDSIATASPAQLLTMLYDRLLLDLGRGEKALLKSDRVEAHKQLTHAQDIIAELMSSLRMDVWDGANQLMALYVFAMKELVNANVAGNAQQVAMVRDLFEPLAQAWHQAAAEVSAANAATVVNNVPATGAPAVASRDSKGGDLGVG